MTFNVLSVTFSKAVTFKIPLVFKYTETSILGTPRGLGGIPRSSNSPTECVQIFVPDESSLNSDRDNFGVCELSL